MEAEYQAAHYSESVFVKNFVKIFVKIIFLLPEIRMTINDTRWNGCDKNEPQIEPIIIPKKGGNEHKFNDDECRIIFFGFQ